MMQYPEKRVAPSAEVKEESEVLSIGSSLFLSSASTHAPHLDGLHTNASSLEKPTISGIYHRLPRNPLALHGQRSQDVCHS